MDSRAEPAWGLHKTQGSPPDPTPPHPRLINVQFTGTLVCLVLRVNGGRAVAPRCCSWGRGACVPGCEAGGQGG